jgi:hypothetical protein
MISFLATTGALVNEMRELGRKLGRLQTDP